MLSYLLQSPSPNYFLYQNRKSHSFALQYGTAKVVNQQGLLKWDRRQNEAFSQIMHRKAEAMNLYTVFIPGAEFLWLCHNQPLLLLALHAILYLIIMALPGQVRLHLPYYFQPSPSLSLHERLQLTPLVKQQHFCFDGSHSVLDLQLLGKLV